MLRPAPAALTRRQWRRRFNTLQMPPMPLALMPPTGQSARAIVGIDKFLSHPGTGIGPATVVQIYRAAEQGYPAEQCDLFADIIEADGHLRDALEGRLLDVIGKPWSVSPAGDDRQSQIAAELCQHALEEINGRDMFAQTLAARGMGYGATEITWTRRDGDVVPKWFHPVPYRRFIFDDADRPRYLKDPYSREGDPLEPGRWLFATNQTPYFHIKARLGLLRTATWFALFKRWSWRDWMVYSEKFGVPLVLGKYAQGTPEEQIDELEQAVQDIGEDGQAVMSKLAEIEILEVARGGDNQGLHAGLVAECNLELSKLITGATLLAAHGGKSSYALGAVHRGRAFSRTLDDNRLLNAHVQQQLFRPMLHWNGLDKARTPILEFHVEEEVDPLTRAKIHQIYFEMGLPLDKEQLYRNGTLRPPPNDERALVKPEPVAPAAPGDGEDNEPEDEDDDE